MNVRCIELLEKFLPKSYIEQAKQTLLANENELRILIEKCKIPEIGWSDDRIHALLNQLAALDSNNYMNSCGLGEREGRLFSNLVSERHFHFAHGVGRSGDLTEVQPKAIGSSIMSRLTNELLLDLVQISGLTLAKKSIVFPMATGMTLSFCMLTIRHTKPDARFVLMPRIDQKSCIKSIATAGFTPIIIENILVGDELCTDLKELESRIIELGADRVACIFSTTSCFAPRACDNVEEISILCSKYKIFHLINNAYGLQSSKITHAINQSARVGRVDAVVQSTDKNLQVPVGGSIVVGFSERVIEDICNFYPGRASAAPLLDVFITIMSMGSAKYLKLLQDRRDCYIYLKAELTKLAEVHQEKVLETPHNPISIGFTLDTFGHSSKEVTFIGSMLFTRFVSGVRVISTSDVREVGSHMYQNFGSHCNNYPHSYLTAAASIGITRAEVDLFVKRLQKVLESVKKDTKFEENVELI